MTIYVLIVQLFINGTGYWDNVKVFTNEKQCWNTADVNNAMEPARASYVISYSCKTVEVK